MERYAIFLDIDGTLMSDGIIPQRNIDTISAARKAGHKVFLNTGRSLGVFPEQVKPIKFDGFVAGIGSHIVCDGTVLKRERFSFEEIYELSESLFDGNRTVVWEGEDYSISNTVFRDKSYLCHSEDEIKNFAEVPITKAYVSGVLPTEIQKLLTERYNFFQHDDYAEFSHKNCCKSGGMKLVLDFLNIPVERCIAIGDSDNDADMLEFAGISVAIGNAKDSIKQMCDIITDTAENAGVAKAIEKLCLCNSN